MVQGCESGDLLGSMRDSRGRSWNSGTMPMPPLPRQAPVFPRHLAQLAACATQGMISSLPVCLHTPIPLLRRHHLRFRRGWLWERSGMERVEVLLQEVVCPAKAGVEQAPALVLGVLEATVSTPTAEQQFVPAYPHLIQAPLTSSPMSRMLVDQHAPAHQHPLPTSSSGKGPLTRFVLEPHPSSAEGSGSRVAGRADSAKNGDQEGQPGQDELLAVGGALLIGGHAGEPIGARCTKKAGTREHVLAKVVSVS
jgi:hypothetical protein